MPVATVSSDIAGFFLAIAFAESIAFRVKPPRLAILLVALVLHDLRSVRDLDHGAEACGEQLVEGRARRRHLDPGRRIRGVREFENIAHQRDAALAVGYDRDLLFLQLRDGLDLLAGRG